MTIITPYNLRFQNTILVRNLGCYLPVLPITCAFALAALSSYFGSHSVHQKVHLTLEEQVKLVEQRRLILICRILIFLCVCVASVLLYLSKEKLFQKYKTLKVTIKGLKMRKEQKPGPQFVPEIAAVDIGHVGPEQIMEKVAAISEFIKETSNFEESDVTESVETSVTEQLSDKRSSIEGHSQETIISRRRSFSRRASEILEKSEDLKTAHVNTSNEDSTEVSECQLPVDDSGLGISFSRSFGSRIEMLKQQTLNSARSCEGGIESFEVAPRMRRNESYIISTDASYQSRDLTFSEPEEAELDEISGCLEIRDECKEKTKIAVTALRQTSKECRDIGRGLEILRFKNESIKNRLNRMLVQIEEVDV